MSDIEEIDRLIKRYGFIIDDKDWDRLSEVFAPNGSFVVEGTDIVHEGFEAVDGFMRTFSAHPIMHYSTNILIDVDEGASRATARVKIFGPRADGTAAIGTYHDTLVRTDAGWRFECRRINLVDRYWNAPNTGR
jgi:hypothetical protein